MASTIPTFNGDGKKLDGRKMKNLDGTVVSIYPRFAYNGNACFEKDEVNFETYENLNENKTEAHEYGGTQVDVKKMKEKKKKVKHDLKVMEKLITGLIVIVIIAVVIILGCLIPVIYFLGDTSRLYRQHSKSQTNSASVEDPFKMEELHKLLHDITTTARMTKRENDQLQTLVRESKIFGYCTHNIPSTACLPCSCTPFNRLDNEYRCDCTNLPPKRDCKDYYDSGFRIDGVYTLQPDGKTNVTVYCDQTHDEGGWEVIQRRGDGSIGFHRDWNEYKLGFGQFHRDFYLGNEHIHILTKGDKELLIKLVDFDNKNYIAKYNQFSVLDDESKYQLNCSGYSAGNARDYFCKSHSGRQFSSYDNDNDLHYDLSCSQDSEGGGGWWYAKCYESNLNGVYYHSRKKEANAIKWFDIDGQNSLKQTEMKIRRPK